MTGRSSRVPLPRAAVQLTLAALGQLLLIVVGVSVSMRADEWREQRAHRAAARAALVAIRTEVLANRAGMARRLPYHRALRDSLQTILQRPVHGLAELYARSRFQGTRDVELARTAYDLALTSQTLTYMTPRLAFAISDVYQQQARFQRIQEEFGSQVFSPTAWTDANAMSLAFAMMLYMGDVTYQEPSLSTRYTQLAATIDSALRTRWTSD